MIKTTYPYNATTYTLTEALLFYRRNTETLATLHKVLNHQLLAGKSLSVQDVEELFHSNDQQKKMVFTPPEIIAWSRNKIVWFEKSCVRPIYFNVPEAKRQFLNQVSGKPVLWPSLVFRISRHHIYCWAVKSKKRPGLETNLYNAPFTNIDTDHCFCPPDQFHNIRDENMVDFTRKAVDIFFRGHFSHLSPNMQRQSVTYSHGRDRFWAKMVNDWKRGECKSFPNRYLVSADMKLRDILS